MCKVHLHLSDPAPTWLRSRCCVERFDQQRAPRARSMPPRRLPSPHQRRGGERRAPPPPSKLRYPSDSFNYFLPVVNWCQSFPTSKKNPSYMTRSGTHTSFLVSFNCGARQATHLHAVIIIKRRVCRLNSPVPADSELSVPPQDRSR